MTDHEFPQDPDERSSAEFVAWLQRLTAAVEEDDLFAILASQRPPKAKLARQQIRGRLIKVLAERLKALKSSASPARTADAWLQERGDDGDLLQGKTFFVEEIAPWELSVVGSDVLDEVEEIFDAYVYALPEARTASVLWTAFSHAFDSFGVAPILDYSSPTKRCGKSTAVVVQRHLCRAALLSGNITPAALFRAVEAWKPTLLIDEADTFAKMSDELRGILNSGHTRDTAFVVRAEGDANEPRMFSTWAPKLVAAIGRLSDTIEDRSIRVVLTRKPTSVTKRDAFDPELVRRDCEGARRRLARFVLDNLDEIASAKVERPDGLHDRAWNNWRPLFAIAAAAGGDWPKRAVKAALALNPSDDDGDGEDVGTLALRHVWEVLEPAGELATVDILVYLVAKDEGPWAKWFEAQVAKGELKGPSARLAKLLKPFGIKPKQLWIGEKNVRGYDAADFTAETVSAYLERNARDARDARTEARSGAGSSIPSNPSVLLEGAREGARPLPGDDTYLPRMFAAFEDGHITEGEWKQAELAHRYVVRAAAA